MNTAIDCIPCFMQQLIRTARLATNDEEMIKSILDEVGYMVKDISMESTPPETADIIYRIIKERTGVDDPYKIIKEKNIKEAISLYPNLKSIINNSSNRLLMAIRLSIAGNVIDFGVNRVFDIEYEMKKIIDQDFAIMHYKEFEENLKHADNILFLGDNAGESVFDRLLIEELDRKVVYAVREKPIINDVTYDDAIASGIDDIADIISSGCTAPATILNQCSEEFLSVFNTSDMIISKGQGNYEGLSDCSRPIFFLLKAKCHIIANDLKINMDDIILKSGSNYE